MTKKLTVFVFGALMLSSAAMAQDYGLAIGIHQTTASVDTSSTGLNIQGSTQGLLGFDAGVLASFEMVKNAHFRTGLLYDQRPFEFKLANGGGNFTFNYAYLDVPVDAQYNFNDMFGVFGGLVVGIKASDSISAPSGLTATDQNMKALYPLVNAGVNMTFQDMFGFDLYYEAGIGNFADNEKNYSTFGFRFVYWL